MQLRINMLESIANAQDLERHVLPSTDKGKSLKKNALIPWVVAVVRGEYGANAVETYRFSRTEPIIEVRQHENTKRLHPYFHVPGPPHPCRDRGHRR